MRILCKYPTRGRPQLLIKRIREWVANATDSACIAFLVSYDEDDASMTPEVIAQAEALHPSVICVKGKSPNKIAACNADIANYAAYWNVILLISDDMACKRQGWDAMICERMMLHFPDTDGAIWFWDGAQIKINTLECVGRKRYEHFGYLYNPLYKSFFCDNEQTAIGLRDKKLIFCNKSIAHHLHPSWLGGVPNDQTYARNNKYWREDQETYRRREAEDFR